MKIVCGLGNYGDKYHHNRHNIGFLAIDFLKEEFNFPKYTNGFKSLYTIGKIGSQKVLLVKPQTFMNLSGKSIAQIMAMYKEPLENLLVIHDDLDLKFLKYKIKTGGSNAGHNGLKSITQCSGNDYNRLRLGIDRPIHKTDVSNYVLSDFKEEEIQDIEDFFENKLKRIELLLENKVEEFTK